jgi:hypothetical protein
MKTITQILGGAQALLDVNFDVQDTFEEYLSDDYKTFLHILRLVESAYPVIEKTYLGIGRKPYPYSPFIRSNLAKSFFKIEKTSAFIQRLKGDPNLRKLCGFEKVPGKATFSRNFALLSETTLMSDILGTIATNEYKDSYACHVSRDSTAIEARETVIKKKSEKKVKKQPGRPKKDEKREPAPIKRIEKQTKQTAEESLKEIGTACAYGCKKNSSGNICFWKGYKLHLDITDTGFPVNAIVTGANVHDSQLAIPMELITEQRIQFCYSLMDAAYDSSAIADFIHEHGRVAIIDPNKRLGKNHIPLDPAKKERFKFRSGVERANGYLKDNLLPAKLFVKGHAKVSFVLLGAVVCLAALRSLQHLLS